MANVIGKKIAKIFTVIIASVMLFCTAFIFTGCETDHPEVEMTIEFNEETYEFTYKLYRNMYPKTVAHYLELIDLEFYDNTVIHDYSTSSSDGKGQGFYGGLYKVNENDIDELDALDYEGLSLKNITVWADSGKDNALNTLVGEFKKNGYKVENNGLTHTLGSLSTSYFLDEDATKFVYTTLESGAGKHYKYNSTTSGFFISKTTNSALDDYYCTFGVLKSQSDKDAFSELTTAIQNYIDDMLENDSEYTFTDEKDFNIAGNDYVDDSKVTFNVPKPEGTITVKKVRVAKY